MVKQTFQWFFDFNTVPDTMQIITVKAGGNKVIKRLAPFFQAYKYFKLGKVSVRAVPASTLPVDPTGLSLEAGEATVDPRDQLSPGLMRITNGEHLDKDLTDVSADDQRLIYANMLLDRRWFKWSLQSGFKKSAIPLAWHVAQLQEDIYSDAVKNLLFSEINDGELSQHSNMVEYYINHTGQNTGATVTPQHSSPRGLFQTGKNVRLGWLPTDAYQDIIRMIYDKDKGLSYLDTKDPSIHPVPEIELMNFITPPAFKTKYYYRMYVTETVYFSEPVTNNLVGYDGFDPTVGSLASLDRFVRASLPVPLKPTVPHLEDTSSIEGMNDGHGSDNPSDNGE